ncbi:hypothetical protein Tco_1294951, partial [Tanacetum coccineum]
VSHPRGPDPNKEEVKKSPNEEDGSNSRGNSKLNGPLEKKSHCSKVGYVFSKIALTFVIKILSKWKEVVIPDFKASKKEKNKRYRSSGNSSSFNSSQSGAGSFNLYTQAGDVEEDVHEVQ